MQKNAKVLKRWRLCPKTPDTVLLLGISGYAPAAQQVFVAYFYCTYYNCKICDRLSDVIRDYYFSQSTTLALITFTHILKYKIKNAFVIKLHYYIIIWIKSSTISFPTNTTHDFEIQERITNVEKVIAINDSTIL